MEKTILGHIDCPTCGTANSMQVTHDKNGKPFGYCQNVHCWQQLRIGGKPSREQAFIRRYPWAAGAVSISAAPEKTAQPAQKIPVTVTTPPDDTPPPKKRSSFEDALSFLGGK